MPLIYPKQSKPKPKRWQGKSLAALLTILLVGGLTANLLRPLPMVTAQPTGLPQLAAQNVVINWPSVGQAAIGAQGFGVLATQNDTSPAATASIAKLITALCVLQKYPLASGQSGPTYTITSADVQIYGDYIAKDGSAILVQEGEQLTEYQMLQAILLPSANNIADSAAVWAFGSLAAYGTYANQYLASHGLAQTHVGVDASGYDPSTTATASDLVKLGEIALQQPVITDIVAQTRVTLPIVGTVYNYNTALGKSGINGIKTGNNDQDPGAFLFTAKVPVGTSTINVIGAVMSQTSLSAALASALPLVASLQAGFEQQTILTAGQTVATYHAPWGATTQAVVGRTMQVIHWKASAGRTTETINDVTANQKTDVVGDATFRSGNTRTATSIVLKKSLAGPSFWWRLTRH